MSKKIADLLRALAEAARKKADELDPPPAPAPAPSPDEGGPGGQPR